MTLVGVSLWLVLAVPPLLGNTHVPANSKPYLPRVFACIKKLSGSEISELSKSSVVEDYGCEPSAKFVLQK
jgi:hypothetical protein